MAETIIGLIDHLLFQKSVRIIVLGLSNAGKSTLVHVLTNDTLMVHAPTAYPEQKSQEIGNILVNFVEYGGYGFLGKQSIPYTARSIRLIDYYQLGPDGTNWSACMELSL